MKQDFRDTRRDYNEGELHRSNLTKEPLDLFLMWLDDAVNKGIEDATAMSLATMNAQGRPSVRIVLLKLADENGFSWFTDKRSKKGQDLTENPVGELLFYWRELSRQVRVYGKVEELSASENDDYFYSRPEASRFSAAASWQSEELSNREGLEVKVEELRAKYPDGNVPRPEAWGGYRMIPEEIEFWQGRLSRLHDRFAYSLQEGEWVARRLSP